MTEQEKMVSEEEYRLFQERMNLPGCARDLTEEELDELKKEGLI